MRESIKYVYDSKGRRYGCVVGIKENADSLDMIGISRCKLSEDDFCKKKAVALARERAIKWNKRDGSEAGHYCRMYDYLLKFQYNGVNEEEKFHEAIRFVKETLNKPKKVIDATESTWTT